jgi:hypothetical protein
MRHSKTLPMAAHGTISSALIFSAVNAGNGSNYLPRRTMAAVELGGLSRRRSHMPSNISFKADGFAAA